MEIQNLLTNQINQNGYHKTVLTREKIGALYTFPIDFTPEDCLACDGYSFYIGCGEAKIIFPGGTIYENA